VYEEGFELPGDRFLAGRSCVALEGSVGLKFARDQFLRRGMGMEIKTPTL
jgi:hypothetical protein